jgi:hypothetical protein
MGRQQLGTAVSPPRTPPVHHQPDLPDVFNVPCPIHVWLGRWVCTA